MRESVKESAWVRAKGRTIIDGDEGKDMREGKGEGGVVGEGEGMSSYGEGHTPRTRP